MAESNRVDMIRSRLEKALAPSSLEIRDDSEQHIGHPGAAAGGGHFSVRIVSEEFRDKSTIERHRMVYLAVEDLMPAEIHALRISALTPGET